MVLWIKVTFWLVLRRYGHNSEIRGLGITRPIPSFRPSFRALTPLLDPLLALKEDLKEGVGALKDGLQEGGIRGFPSYDRT